MIRVTFQCGHEQQVEDVTVAPVCNACGNERVVAVKAPPPRFTGSCTGPLVVKS